MADLNKLLLSLESAQSFEKKREILISWPSVQALLVQVKYHQLLIGLSLEEQVVLLSVMAIGQAEVVLRSAKRVLPQLVLIDRFYDSIGGIVGYHATALRLLAKKPASKRPLKFSSPPGVDISRETPRVREALRAGILALPSTGELFPIGGLGARLSLEDDEGNPLPVALLPFCGRSLLEGLVRDVQAREFLYYKLTGKQIVIPIAMMSSLEKENHAQIERLFRETGWFGRPSESFCLFTQLSVPVITREGNWSMVAPDQLNVHPGGHGALWKTAEEKGVFRWFLAQSKEQLLIRQINNPIAGVDHGLLSLIGVGKMDKKTFGFASCKRVVCAAEGVLVEVEEPNGDRHISNIEYTQFAENGIEDKPTEEGYSLYPTNTNILYVDLLKLLPIIREKPLPGLHLNVKMRVPFLSPTGERSEVEGGRLESMMQNISDSLKSPPGESLPTFVTYNERIKTISVAKKQAQKNQSLLETPEGAFEDLQRNAHDLLKNYCGVDLRPSTLFLYHPALGPCYNIVRQKIRGGIFGEKSELQLEITELLLDQLELEGSLLIEAENGCGHRENQILRYSSMMGKCRLKNVKVRNRGIDYHVGNIYWKNQIRRQEALKIILQGCGEFEAEGAIFTGAQTFVVPDKERWVVRGDELTKEKIEGPTWRWNYSWEEGQILLSEDSVCRTPVSPDRQAPLLRR